MRHFSSPSSFNSENRSTYGDVGKHYRENFPEKVTLPEIVLNWVIRTILTKNMYNKKTKLKGNTGVTVDITLSTLPLGHFFGL